MSVETGLVERGWEAVRVSGSADYADVDLGPFMAIETSAGRDRAPALVERLATPSSAVLVDDAHALDPASAALVSALVRAGGVVVAAVSHLDDVPSSLLALVDSGEMELARLPALMARELVALASDSLEAPLTPRAQAALVALAHGSPLVVRETVRASRLAGTLVNAGGVWDLVGDLRVGPRIARRVAPDLAGLDDAAADAWGAVCLARGLPAEALGSEAVLALRRRGLVDLVGELVVPADPLWAAAWREGRSKAAVRFAADTALAALSRTEGEAPRAALARVHVAVGRPLSPDVALPEAEFALQSLDAVTAARLADLGLAADPRHCVLLTVRGGAASLVGDVAGARRFFEQASEVASSDAEWVALARARASHLSLVERDPAAAVALLEDSADRLDARERLAGDLLLWSHIAGMPVPAHEVDLSGGALDALAATMFAALIAGPLDLAQKCLEAFDSAVPAGVPHPPAVAMSRLMVLSYQGKMNDAREYATQALHLVEGSPEVAGAWEFTLGMIELTTGDLVAARELAERAVTHLKWRDPLGLVGAAIALNEAVLTAVGDLRVASATEAVNALDPKVLMLEAWSQAWLLRESRKRGEAARVLAEAARALAVEFHHPFLAAMLAHCAASMGRPGAVLEVLDACVPAGGIAEYFRDFADDVHRKDVDALAAWVDRFEAWGMTASALDTLAMLLDLSPSPRPWKARLDALAPGPQAVLPTWYYRPVAVTLLSAREREIAQLAAGRKRSREIADHLGISVRTVDKHLSAVYVKLGVTGRDELMRRAL